ncbi:flagellar hook-length control protein FliK [Pseudooceanicola sp. HF7]|uniref:flagellar hook-length control protein FliK n=1 Tax=Pseudooceanicola sp. HF7 TaxID=2721560 RepID=UPI001430E113|nr:flagellar hook-length control protein FliK [Pseudooceanicola sp. HF7]NIZ09742.1 hypothetical protein [Pseudooceanicola sp. HF7]
MNISHLPLAGSVSGPATAPVAKGGKTGETPFGAVFAASEGAEVTRKDGRHPDAPAQGRNKAPKAQSGNQAEDPSAQEATGKTARRPANGAAQVVPENSEAAEIPDLSGVDLAVDGEAEIDFTEGVALPEDDSTLPEGPVGQEGIKDGGKERTVETAETAQPRNRSDRPSAAPALPFAATAQATAAQEPAADKTTPAAEAKPAAPRNADPEGTAFTARTAALSLASARSGTELAALSGSTSGRSMPAGLGTQGVETIALAKTAEQTVPAGAETKTAPGAAQVVPASQNASDRAQAVARPAVQQADKAPWPLTAEPQGQAKGGGVETRTGLPGPEAGKGTAPLLPTGQAEASGRPAPQAAAPATTAPGLTNRTDTPTARTRPNAEPAAVPPTPTRTEAALPAPAAQTAATQTAATAGAPVNPAGREVFATRQTGPGTAQPRATDTAIPPAQADRPRPATSRAETARPGNNRLGNNRPGTDPTATSRFAPPTASQASATEPAPSPAQAATLRATAAAPAAGQATQTTFTAADKTIPLAADSPAASDPAPERFSDLLPLTDAPRSPQAITRADQARADLARHVAAQLANASTRLAEGQTELRLNPEELGRVTLRLTTEDSHVMLHVTAERPETSDLMRRHLGMLEQSYRALGYERIEISINGGRTDAQGRQGGDGAQTGAGPALSTAEQPADPATPLKPPPGIPSGDRVDIRL